MNFDTFLKSISKIENLDLPGEASQIKMSPPYRLELMERNREAMKTARMAGVMALFYPSVTNETYLILILRKTYKGVHSAQVGFPGGKLETDDSSLEFAALRETYEEVGVPIKMMKVLKAMTPMYIPPSNFTVNPFLGVTHTTPNFVKQDEEVEDLIEVSLSHFLEENNVVSTSVATSYKVKVDVPAFKLNNHIVWGATAMMLSELKDLLKTVL
ncbi:NUDIX hydrolase [Ichthyenterobacterium magnum]|uniref:NUDIX domain-containing protein n=1 Tax=Ichthyenterobacterium magnum TaxID=1230530 RepID=A0A420DGL7_9FLAO|nr:CoA pyrophosphatase [Ichthyenterobacterium magnum]RKE92235.1 NUDIX domain-containing protein [Ichthyenterobacterium magnum]